MKKLLCSACLLGTPCRYDGRSKPIPELEELRRIYELHPVCPEVLGGLDTPRIPCEICDERVIRKDGEDLTIPYTLGAEKSLKYALDNEIAVALFKEKSPSCGVHLRYDGSFKGNLVQSCGVTTALLIKNGITVYSEDELDQLL